MTKKEIHSVTWTVVTYLWRCAFSQLTKKQGNKPLYQILLESSLKHAAFKFYFIVQKGKGDFEQY